MIRSCPESDFDAILAVINDGARAYREVIPSALWRDPYMPRDELGEELAAGVVFWGYDEGRGLVGVMGLQHVAAVSLIRHAYVRTERQGQGIGGQLLVHLRSQTNRPVLIGTWAAAAWAVRFYVHRGFRIVSPEDKDRLLERYWTVPRSQREASVVLADAAWFAQEHAD